MPLTIRQRSDLSTAIENDVLEFFMSRGIQKPHNWDKDITKRVRGFVEDIDSNLQEG